MAIPRMNTPPMCVPVAVILMALLSHGCQSDPRTKMHEDRIQEMRSIILKRHGRMLSDREVMAIQGQPSWFHTIAMEGVPPTCEWVWLIGGNRELVATFAGRMNEPLDPSRVTIKIDSYQDPARSK